ncbi:MAG: hypothetical protein ABI601_05700 [bacterium]
MTITLRALASSDLPMLCEWIARPHMAEWWDAPPSLAECEAEYGPLIAGEVSHRGSIALLLRDGRVPRGGAGGDAGRTGTADVLRAVRVIRA